MGLAPSIFSLGESQTNLRVERKLQKILLEYLRSDDYTVKNKKRTYNRILICKDINKYYPEIRGIGYLSLEAFIGSIPPSDETDWILNEHAVQPVALTLGMRFVVSNAPHKKGVLSEKICELPTGKLATLCMDQQNFHHNLLIKSINYILYFFTPIDFIIRSIFGYRMVTKADLLHTYHLNELTLEKNHFRAYLQPYPQPPSHLHLIPASVVKSQVQEVKPLPPSKVGPVISPPTMNTEGKRKEPPVQHQPKKKRKSKNITPEKKEIIPDTFEQQAEPEPFMTSGPVGEHKGIEGAHNSCYMDSLLFSMFYTSQVFDFLLFKAPNDTKYMKKTRRLLKNIVRSLRQVYYCNYETVWSLREHLGSKNEDLLGAFMDAEQVLYLLCDEVLKEHKFIQYAGVDDDGWGDMMHLMSIDPADPLKIITVQKNVEFSFAFNGNIKMASVPNPALILGMPRSNRELVHYEAVVPNLEIDITTLMKSSNCQLCIKEKAVWEIQPQPDSNDNSDITPVCNGCLTSNQKRKNIMPKSEHKVVNRTAMRLRSIVCIRGVHFVAFVRSDGGSHCQGNDEQIPATGEDLWYFFDSMAGGYPEVEIVPKLGTWLEQVTSNTETFYTSEIPGLVKRSMTDGHLCIYEPIYHENIEN